MTRLISFSPASVLHSIILCVWPMGVRGTRRLLSENAISVLEVATMTRDAGGERATRTWTSLWRRQRAHSARHCRQGASRECRGGIFNGSGTEWRHAPQRRRPLGAPCVCGSCAATVAVRHSCRRRQALAVSRDGNSAEGHCTRLCCRKHRGRQRVACGWPERRGGTRYSHRCRCSSRRSWRRDALVRQGSHQLRP